MYGLYNNNINRNSETQHQPLWCTDPNCGKRTNQKKREIIKMIEIIYGKAARVPSVLFNVHKEWI